MKSCQGFVGHPRNTALREKLRSGQVSLTDFRSQLLRLVYRLIFLFVAEDRTLEGIPLLHPPDSSEEGRRARESYSTHYSTSRLRELASRIKGSRHGDLWHQFNLLVGALSGEERYDAARKHLALPVLGSLLWSPGGTAALNTPSLAAGDGVELANADFLEAIRQLAFTRQGKILRPVDYKNLGSEELGGVYESLLALTPQISGDGARFTFAEFAGNERKTSGSYYTPDSLVQCLLDSALAPVVGEAIKGKAGADAEKAILSLKVCDPAVGSGHFLVGAAHRLARHLARVRAVAQGESEPSPPVYQHALRDVISHCLYGVDINPMAAELCRVSLWLEALEPGKPLSFLDHHIRVGNSLLGTTPELIVKGIPDAAYKPIEGDDKKACAELKKQNRSERKGLGPLFAKQDAEVQAQLAKAAAELEELPDDRPEDIQFKELFFRDHEESEEYRHKRLLADAWCAAFVIKKYLREPGRESSATGVTQRNLNDLAGGRSLSMEIYAEVERLATQYQFFHWHLAFPEVFARGGFDCVLGNPPWERVKLQEKEWFAERSPEIANAPNAAARKRLIEALRADDAALYNQFHQALRQADGETHILRNGGCYPLCGLGDINLYAVFAELMRGCLASKGRFGAIFPSGLATDDTTKHFFGDLMKEQALVSFTEFENEGFFQSAGQGHMLRFALTTVTGSSMRVTKTDFAFQLKSIDELMEASYHFTLTKDDIALFSPNTGSCPIFRLPQDAQLNKHIYRRVPILVREVTPELNPWKMRLLTMFHMANDSSLFLSRQQLYDNGWLASGAIYRKDEDVCVPLIEAKLVHQFNHRHGDFSDAERGKRAHILPEVPVERLGNDAYLPAPFYWVPQSEVEELLKEVWECNWLMGWRRVTDSRASARTFIACLFPRYGVGDNVFLSLPQTADAAQCACLLGTLNAFVFDYTARQKLGGINLLFFVFRQLPVVPPLSFALPCRWSADMLREWLLPRILELTYTAWDLEPFAHDCGYHGPPFRWDEERRFLIRCELDAAFFHLYLGSEEEWRKDPESLTKYFPTPRHAVEYIMETFPIVKRKDEAAYGSYRTKDTILEIYDALAEAIGTDQPYRTRLDPPPGPPADDRGNFLPLPEWLPGQPQPPNWPSHIHPPRGVNDK